MRILALETATEACSAALYLDGAILERFELAPRRHTELILPMLEALLNEAGLILSALDALAFGCGPGAFTCVRIAAAVVQGLALGASLKVVPVSTLAALALEAFCLSDADYALVALDARMGEVYWGVYRRGQGAVVPDSLFSPDKVITPEGIRGVGVGPGWEAYGEALRLKVGSDRLLAIWPQQLPKASAIVQLAAEKLAHGEAVMPAQALPVYLRDRVVSV